MDHVDLRLLIHEILLSHPGDSITRSALRDRLPHIGSREPSPSDVANGKPDRISLKRLTLNKELRRLEKEGGILRTPTKILIINRNLIEHGNSDTTTNEVTT